MTEAQIRPYLRVQIAPYFSSVPGRGVVHAATVICLLPGTIYYDEATYALQETPQAHG